MAVAEGFLLSRVDANRTGRAVAIVLGKPEDRTTRSSRKGWDAQRFFRVDTSASLATNSWTYSLVEIYWAGPSIDDWLDVADGIEIEAWNYAEVMNSASGFQGNQVEIATGVTILPIQNGTKPIKVDFLTAADGTTAYWFNIANGIQVDCA